MITPLFSIITACYNAREDLLITANSLDSQTFKNFEWIVIDGNSNDGTKDILSCLSSLTCWISEPDEGIADAWNKGIGLCKGSQVLFLNAGDIYDNEMLLILSHHVSEEYITCCHTRLGNKNPLTIFQARPNLLWRGMHVPHNWCSVPFSKYIEFGLYNKIKHSMDFEWFARYYSVYGHQGFKVVDQVLGTYALGGYSDVTFADGFRENERILITLGMSHIKARILRISYTVKHYLRYRFRLLKSFHMGAHYQ